MLIISCEKFEDLTEKVEFYEPGFFGTCFSGVYDRGYNEVIIADNESYQKFGNSIRTIPYNLNCDAVALPYIDFDKHILICKFTGAGGCDANYDRQIVNDKKKNKIIYAITVEYPGTCKMYIVNMNWALVPKIDNNLTVEFKVTYI